METNITHEQRYAIGISSMLRQIYECGATLDIARIEREELGKVQEQDAE